MLDRKTRQRVLKNLGFYKGEINGKWDTATKAAVKKFQETYMPKKYWDGGKYTEEVNKWIVSANRVKKSAPHFKLEEFKCKCGGKYCSGLPAYLNEQLLKNLEKIRTTYNKPITVTCGERCHKYNLSKNGSIANSKHQYGKAVDFYVPGVTDTVEGRKKLMQKIKKMPKFNYTYGYIPGSTSARERSATYMGNCLHMDVK